MIFGPRSGHKMAGLEIGPAELRLALMQQQGERRMLIGSATEPTPAGAVGPDGIADPIALGLALRRLTERVPLRGARLSITLDAGTVLFRRAQFPAMDYKAMRQTILLQREEHLPLAELDLFADCAASQQDNTGPMDVLLYATPQSTLSRLWRACKMARLKPFEVVPPYSSIYRLAHAHEPLPLDGKLAILHIRPEGPIRTYTFRGGTPVLVRNLLSHAAHGDGGFLEIRQSIQVGGHIPEHVLAFGDPALADWCTELEGSLNRTNRPSGSAAMPTPTPVRIRLISESAVLPGPAMAVAVGLALAPAPGEFHLDLLRSRLLQGDRSFRRKAALWTVAAAVLGFAYGLWWWAQWGALRAESEFMAEQLALEPVLPPVKGSELIPKYQPFMAEMDRQMDWSGLLRDLYARAGEAVILGPIKIKVSNQEEQTPGADELAFTATASSYAEVTAFIENLRANHSRFRRVELLGVTRTELKSDARFNFDVRIELQLGGGMP